MRTIVLIGLCWGVVAALVSLAFGVLALGGRGGEPNAEGDTAALAPLTERFPEERADYKGAPERVHQGDWQ